MPFGSTNSPIIFQRFMNNALYGLSDYSDVYLDDILVFRRFLDDHFCYDRAVLLRLTDKQLQSKH